jgi:hypothetical protein
MNNLKRLVVSLSLNSILAATAVAGEAQAPPCAPGEMQSPPCSSAQQATDETVSEQSDVVPCADTLDLTSVAVDALSAMLVLF